MSNRPQLAVDNTPEDPFAGLLEALDEMYGGGDDGLPVPTKHRHQLLNPDFWFFAGATVCVFFIFTSYTQTNLFEPLLTAAIFLNACGLVANLTREKQGIIVHEIVHKLFIKIQWPWQKTQF